MIEGALKPLIKEKRKIEQIALYVSLESALATIPGLKTSFGWLRIKVVVYIPKGTSYLMEDPGIGRSFAWISRKNAESQEGMNR